MKRSAADLETGATGVAKNSASTDIIIVRVGGQDFRTSRATLKQDDRGYFAALMQHQEPTMDDHGPPVYEVDRDPEPFRYVLTWMRSHRISPAIADAGMLEDLEAEATFYGLDDLVAAVQTALVPLRLAAEPLRAFSITCGSVLVRNSGQEVQQDLVLAPHEYCFVSYATCATNLFGLARKHHTVWCHFKEREAGGEHWKQAVPPPSGPSPAPADFVDNHAWHAQYQAYMKAQTDHETSRVLLASFV